MHPVFEIETRVRAYLERESTLQELREWFVGVKGPLLALSAETTATRLATALELGSIEMRDGSFTERQLRRLLRAQLEGTSYILVAGNPEITLSDANNLRATATFDVGDSVITSVTPVTLAGTSS